MVLQEEVWLEKMEMIPAWPGFTHQARKGAVKWLDLMVLEVSSNQMILLEGRGLQAGVPSCVSAVLGSDSAPSAEAALGGFGGLGMARNVCRPRMCYSCPCHTLA